MEYYISTVIITQLSLLSLIVLVAKNKVLPKRVKTGVITASALIMVCAFAEFSGVLLDGAATILKPLHIVVKYIEFCVAADYSACVFICILSDEIQKNDFSATHYSYRF